MTTIDYVRAASWRAGASAGKVDFGLVAVLHRKVGEALTVAQDQRRLGLEDERALAHKLVSDELRQLAEEAYGAGREALDDEAEAALRAAVMDRLHGLGRIQPMLEDADVRDIHICGHARTWVVLRDGAKVAGPPAADSEEELVELISTAARRLGRTERRWDAANPTLELELPNGDRLHAVMAVSTRPAITIRRHDFRLHRLAQLIELGLCDDTLGGFLSAAVRSRCNIIIAGGVNAGKTTTLRCLINEIDPLERLITIEDQAEIGLHRFDELHPDHETLEARRPNTEGAGAVTMAQLVRDALRMNPDRVIVGEVRGAEMLPMLLAMSQGNEGSMCTIHADSSKGVFQRFRMYGLLTAERLQPDDANLLVAGAVDLIVHLGRVDGIPRVTSVREVTGGVEAGQVASNELWRPGPDRVALPASPPSGELTTRLESHGYSTASLATAQGWWRQ